MIPSRWQISLLLLITSKKLFSNKKNYVKFDSVASSGGQGNFPWPFLA